MDDPLLTAFGACSDEVHDDLDTALSAMRALGMRQVELLEYWGKPVTELTEDELSETERLLERHEMTVSAIGSLFLKAVTLGSIDRSAVTVAEPVRREWQTLEGTIRVARRLGAPLVRTFGFRRDQMVGLGNPSARLPGGGAIPDEILDKIVEGLRAAAETAAAAGLRLGLENVRSCWANSGLNTARILQAVDHPALVAIWDPGNDYVSAPGTYQAGYEAVRPYIAHVHVKDARVVDQTTGLTAWEAVGAGEVDYVGQFAALRRDGFAGTLSLETHWHPRPPGGGEPDRIADSRRSFAGIRQALAASWPSSQEIAP